MNLLTYIKKLNNEELESFALSCSTTVGQLKQVAYEHRRAGESLAINIDRETKGAVMCEELRPDVDWQYLRGRRARKRA